ncbi:MAG: MFS transporter [Acidimicrobiales bacterium]
MSFPGHLARLTRQLRDALAGLFDQDHAFGRLALVHTIFSAGTTLVTISLAGSLFFSVSVNQSEHKVLLYLLLSIAPFAIVSPLLSPLLDKGVTARRAAVGLASGGSAVLALFMSRDLHSLLLFPEAFGILVLSKLYLVGKAALVPSMTDSTDDLASANAKLAVLAALGGFAASPFGVALLKAGAPWVLRFTFLVFVCGTVAALRLPKSNTVPASPKSLGQLDDGRPILGPTAPAPLPLPAQPQPGSTSGRPGGLIYRSRSGRAARPPRIDVAKERRRLGLAMIAPEVTVALGAMTVLRGTMGFMTFFLAFALKHLGEPAWWYGLILLTSGIGGLAGSMAVPSVRRRLSEQQIILSALVLTTVVGVVVAILGSLWAQPILAFTVGVASTGAKPAFDSIAQTYVPPAALGRSFARFETQLQLCWVGSALIAVLVSFKFASGDVLIAAACAIAAAFHYSMRHTFMHSDAGHHRGTATAP